MIDALCRWGDDALMPQIVRAQSGGLYTHVINRGNDRQRVFHDDADYAAFVELLGAACERVAAKGHRKVACPLSLGFVA